MHTNPIASTLSRLFTSKPCDHEWHDAPDAEDAMTGATYARCARCSAVELTV